MTDMTKATLYYSGNLNPRVAVAVARHLESPVIFTRADPMGVDKERFRSINPNTLLPVLVEKDRTLWEADAIALRLSLLSGTDFWPAELGPEMMMWISWSAHHFTRAGGAFYFENIIVPQYMGRAPDEAVLAEATADFLRFGQVLEDYLAGRTYLVGDHLTYADFRVASALPYAARAKIPLERFRHISRWHDRLNRIDAWREPFAGLD